MPNPELEAADVWLDRKLGGRYRLVRRIGAGGGGAVYEAVQEGLGRAVAVKILRSDYARYAVQLERFRREARAVARLGHPNIVQLIDFVDPQGDEPAYLVLELVAGRSLHAVLENEKTLAPSRAVAIALQILAALEAAHGAGIVHRDLKPANVMLAEAAGVGEVAKLLDFGVAQIEAEVARLTAAGLVVGTPRYMSPEQASGGTVDTRSDLWSLGVTLYRMVAGVFPFEGSRREIELGIFGAPPPKMVASLGVPTVLEDVIVRALAKSPEARWPSAAAMAEALRAAVPVREAKAYAVSSPSAIGTAMTEPAVVARASPVAPTMVMGSAVASSAPGVQAPAADVSPAATPKPRRWPRRLALLLVLLLIAALVLLVAAGALIAAYVYVPEVRALAMQWAPAIPWPAVPRFGQ